MPTALGQTCRFLILATSLVFLTLVASPSRASASYWRHCGQDNHGPGFGWDRLKAHHIHCHKARAVANGMTFGFRYWGYRPYGFNCHTRGTAEEISVARCRRDKGSRIQKVQFRFGA
jgi:hypothetical protein